MNTFVKLGPCLYNQSTLEQGELSSLAAEIASIQTIVQMKLMKSHFPTLPPPVIKISVTPPPPPPPSSYVRFFKQQCNKYQFVIDFVKYSSQ